jgi:RNA polymerase sigma-70 factor (ECF subfamily)
MDVSDTELLSKSVGGDAAAFESLINRYQDRVYRTALGLVGNESDAQELAQDVFLTLYRKGHQFRGDSALSSWIYRITHNLGKNILLRRKVKYIVSLDWVMDHLPQVTAQPDTSAAVEQSDHYDTIIELMQHLDFLSRHILILREVHDLSYEEISETTQLPLGTIKSRLSRAKAKIKQMAEHSISNRGEFYV